MLNEHESYRDFLRDELVRRIRHNPRYSQRAFARQLGISPGELSEVLAAKRHLSPRSALKAAKSLGLSIEETELLLWLIQKERVGALEPRLNSAGSPPSGAPTRRSERALALDLFQLVSDWGSWAVLSLAETEGFAWDAKWISKKLGLSPQQAQDIVSRLVRVGLVEQSETGELKATNDHSVVQSGVPSEALRAYHSQILRLALDSLDFVPREFREIAGTTFPVNPADLPAIKKEMDEFLDRVSQKYSAHRPLREVYHLELALLPLTQKGFNA